MWVVCVMLAAGGVGAAPTAHVRGADGEWREVPVEQAEGRVTVRLAPADGPGGRATLVVNKPAWMRLDDDAPPLLLTVALGEEGIAVNGELDLGVVDADAPPLTVRVADERNPVDPASFRLALSGAPGPAQVTARAGPPERTGEFVVELPRLAPGSYRGEFVVTDMSPQGNALRVPVRLAVFGIAVAEDLSRVTCSTGAAAFRLDRSPKLPIVVEGGGQQLYITGQPPGALLYPREITGAELIVDTPERKVCRVVAAEVGTHDGRPVDEPGRFEFDLEVRSDLPCLIVRSRCFNETRDGETYAFWGWPGGAGFHTPDGEQEWSMTYRDIGKVGWVFLPSAAPDSPGLGWISPLKFGESRFGTMLLYTEPTRIPTRRGEAVEMDFALMPAMSAEEVAEVAERLEGLGVWDGEE